MLSDVHEMMVMNGFYLKCLIYVTLTLLKSETWVYTSSVCTTLFSSCILAKHMWFFCWSRTNVRHWKIKNITNFELFKKHNLLISVFNNYNITHTYTQIRKLIFMFKLKKSITLYTCLIGHKSSIWAGFVIFSIWIMWVLR